MAELTLERVAMELFDAAQNEDVKLMTLMRKLPRPRVYQPINGSCFDSGATIRVSIATNRCDLRHWVRIINADTGEVVPDPVVIPITCDPSGGLDGTGLMEQFPLPELPDGNYVLEIEVEGSFTSGPSFTVPCRVFWFTRFLKWLGIK